MNKLLLLGLTLSPIALLANSDGAETDIVQRTVNFIIFAGILWYILADKIKAFFSNRSLEIQAELDKVQDTLKASKDRVDNAASDLDEAKKLSIEIIQNAKEDIASIKAKIALVNESEILNLGKNFDAKIEVETRKAKKEVVTEVLNELLKSENIQLSQEELATIVLKKVA